MLSGSGSVAERSRPQSTARLGSTSTTRTEGSPICEPVSAGIAAGASILSTIVGAAGNYQQGQADAERFEQNKRLAELAAGDATVRGEKEAGLVRIKGTKIAAEQQVAYGMGGVDATVGSAADAIAETRMFSELDAQMVRNNAAKEAWGYKVEAYNAHENARMSRRRAIFGTAGTVLGGVGDAAVHGTRFGKALNDMPKPAAKPKKG